MVSSAPGSTGPVHNTGGFSHILGQREALDFLRRMLQRGNLPSAMLFTGVSNVGKYTTALALAQALNCTTSPGEGCGACPPCRKITEGVHPDIAVVEPDGQFLKIDQIREVGNMLGLVPREAQRRVIIVRQAERMHQQSANAFLKTLEEPPLDTLIILSAIEGHGLPETIVSRCIPLRFAPLGRDALRRLFAEKIPEEAMDFALRFSQGRVRPDLLERAAHWQSLRERLIRQMEGLHRGKFGSLVEDIGKWAANDDWRFVLEWLESCFHDIALFSHGAALENLINGDKVESVQQWCARYPAERAQRAYQALLATREEITVWNVNKALAMEALWLRIKDLAVKSAA